MQGSPPVTIVETPEFLASAGKLLHEDERASLIDYLAYNPAAGAVIAGTGGVRKLRWGWRGAGNLFLSRHGLTTFHPDRVCKK